MRVRALCVLASCLLVGCSSCSSTSSLEPTTTPSGTSETHGDEPADYEVHEWGLLRGQRDGSADVLRVGAVAPPRPIEVMAVDKPVLYFHSEAPQTLRSVAVHVDGGTILETWPFVEGRTDARWSDVALGPSVGCDPSALPDTRTLPCSALAPGAFCESASLALVRTDDAACVRTGGSTERFLFYRAQSHTFTPPLRFARTQVYEDVRVDNDGDLPIPGVLVRIWSDGRRTRTMAVAPPPPHGSVVIGHDFDDVRATDDLPPADHPVLATDESLPEPTVTGDGRAGIARTLSGLGLTQSEVQAFFRAWEGTLFGEPAHAGATADGTPADVLTVDRLSVDGDPAPRDSVIYFLPEATADGVAELRFDPPPRTVRRALAIWTAIRASGEGR